MLCSESGERFRGEELIAHGELILLILASSFNDLIQGRTEGLWIRLQQIQRDI